MAIRLKRDVDPEALRKFGFNTGKEWSDQGERCLEGCSYAHGWYHKFAMDPDYPEKILYADEDNDEPVVSIAFRIGEHFDNDLYIDCVPSCTYHIGGDELDIVVDTLYDLFNAGLVEKI